MDVLDIATPSAPTRVGSIEPGLQPSSVAVHDGVLAVALEADPKTDRGQVTFHSTSCDPSDCPALGGAMVGALPGMLTFSPSGRYVIVPNEGEADGATDPQGTVSVIDLRST